MCLPQSNVISFHLKETGFNSLQVICPNFYLHAQQVDVCLIAALLQGKRVQKAWEQGQAMTYVESRCSACAAVGNPILYHQDPVIHTQELFNHSTMPGL